MFNVPVVGFVISFKNKKSIRALLLCYTTSQNIFPNSHFFPLFHLLSGLVVDLFKRELTGTSKMHACGISQVDALKSELFPFLLVQFAGSMQSSAFLKFTLSRQKKKNPSTYAGKCIFSS